MNPEQTKRYFMNRFKKVNNREIENKKQIDLGGQIWEECEKCGKEPVYLRFYLCEDCSRRKVEFYGEDCDQSLF